MQESTDAFPCLSIRRRQRASQQSKSDLQATAVDVCETVRVSQGAITVTLRREKYALPVALEPAWLQITVCGNIRRSGARCHFTSALCPPCLNSSATESVQTKDGLLASQLSRHVLIDGGPRPVNIAALIKQKANKLNLEAIARQDALNGLPTQAASKLTAAETSAVAEAERCGKDELARIDQVVAETRTAIGRLNTALRNASRERARVDSAIPPPGIDLQSRVNDRDRAQAAYNAFQTDNGLTRDATGDDRMKQVLWATVIVLVEGLVNSYFYAPVSAFGLLGGFSIAFFVSFANVAFAFIGGAGGLRYLSHIDPLKKLVGVLVSLGCLLISLLVITLSTLFRGHVDLLEGSGLDPSAMETEAWRLAVESLRDLDVWALMSSVNSFLLVLVGLACAIFAFHKGWQYDDPYPGFGTAFRAKERATEAYEDACEQNAAAAAAWSSKQVDDLRQASKSVNDALAEVDADDQGLRVLLSKSARLSRDVGSLARGLLGVYRKTNEAVRASEAPNYFDRYPEDDQFGDFDQDMQVRRSDAARLEGDIGTAREDVKTEQKLIEDAIAAVRSP